MHYTFPIVLPKKSDLILEGLPNEVEEGTEVELTCIVKRVKPELSEIYWKTAIGHKEKGTLSVTENKDGTLKYQSVIKYMYVANN